VLFDVRTYRTLPGHVPAQLEIYKKYGYPVQLRYMGEPLMYAVAESGALNTFTHVWVYDSAADREAKRAKISGPGLEGLSERERQGRASGRTEQLPDDAGAVGTAGSDAENHQVAALRTRSAVSQR
jgi:hypothetical protein